MKDSALTYSAIISLIGWALILALFVGFNKIISIQPFGVFLLLITTGIATGTFFRRVTEQQ